ncbi:MAG: hypothetical protein WC817_00445 [Patescibacteria group bacterium]|jgi:hypothetical protein
MADGCLFLCAGKEIDERKPALRTRLGYDCTPRTDGRELPFDFTQGQTARPFFRFSPLVITDADPMGLFHFLPNPLIDRGEQTDETNTIERQCCLQRSKFIAAVFVSEWLPTRSVDAGRRSFRLLS